MNNESIAPKTLVRGLLIAATLVLPAALSAQTVWQGNFGNKTITTAGTYQIGPDAQGNPAKGTIKIKHTSGTVILEGTNGLVRDFYTNGSVSNPGAVIESDSSAGSTTIRNIVVRNDGSFGVTLRGGSTNLITNCKVLSQDSDYTQDGFGIATKASGSMTNCVTKVSDDSYKLYGSDTTLSSSTAEQWGNGSCIQYGWGGNSIGSNHTADLVTCKSDVIGFSSGSSDSGTNPGRSIVGWHNNDTGANNNVQATNLAISSPGNNWSHTANLTFSGGATCTTMKFTGAFASGNPSVRTNAQGTFTPVKVKIAGTGTKIDGFTLNFGGVFKDSGGVLSKGNNLVYISDTSKVLNRSIQ